MNGPPVILAFGADATALTAGEQVTFTAFVDDPDGIDDIVGGTLRDAGGAIHGAFTTTGQQGSYQMTLTWAQIDKASSIDFAQGATATRTFEAQFFDRGGRTVEKTVDLTLTCNGKAACSGACVDQLADTQNCGACGRACSGGACWQGDCPSLSECLLEPNLTTCDKYCASRGTRCANTCTMGDLPEPVGGLVFGDEACTAFAESTTCASSIEAAKAVRCCCAE